jgi:hypothetical protein
MTKQDTGAAATLKRWEQQELAESETVKKCESDLNRLRKLKQTEDNIARVRNAEYALDAAKERWEDTSKVLLSFERGVAPEKREGEKLLASYIEDFLENTFRAIRISNAAFGLSIAQDAIRCKDEQEYYLKHNESCMKNMENAVKAGIENNHMPALVMRAFERSL